eukprot:360622-Chlamydomonas_euryale.AAC.24
MGPEGCMGCMEHAWGPEGCMEHAWGPKGYMGCLRAALSACWVYGVQGEGIRREGVDGLNHGRGRRVGVARGAGCEQPCGMPLGCAWCGQSWRNAHEVRNASMGCTPCEQPRY